jgi:pimeloyl-ACP methyl ester carboxylesterase
MTDINAALAPHPRGPRLLALVQQRQRMLKDAWLTAVGHQRPGMNKGLPLPEADAQVKALREKIHVLAQPLPGRRSVWNGFDRYDFDVAGKPVLVVAPKTALPGKPWVWHGEFFGHKPAPDIALLGKGLHVVYMNIPDMLGAPQAVEYWNSFYSELTTNFGFAPKAALVGLSRGGLYCYNWATANPEKVACIYGDAPVCDLKSWPGGKGKGKGSPADWRLVFQLYRFGSEDEALAYKGNPVDRLASLAQFKVPLLHVYGDADDVVPWDENTGLVANRYRELGGPITLVPKPGVGHHPHGLDDSTPIINFIYTNCVPVIGSQP